MHSIAKHAARSLVPLIGLACIAACGGSSEVGILINLANLPTRTSRIEVKGTLDGRPALSDQNEFAASGLTRFGIKVPSTEQGNLTIDLTVYDADRCVQGTSTVMTSLPTARGKEVTASISAKAPRQCEPLLPCPDANLCPVTKTQNNRLWGVWAISHTDVWAVGDSSTVLHWDGKTWTPQSAGILPGISLQGIWASAAKDIWIIGSTTTPSISGYVYHYDGTRWTRSLTSARYLTWIHGTSKQDVFIVGGSNASGTMPGEFRRYNAAADTWDSVNHSTNQDLYAVWASSPNDVWLAGGNGTLLRYDGSSVATIPLAGISSNLFALHGYLTPSGQTIVYAVGDSGVVVRYDGSPHKSSINTVPLWSVQANLAAVYVTTTAGTIYKSQGVTDTFSAFSLGSDVLYGIHIAPNGIGWVTGASGFQGYIDTRP